MKTALCKKLGIEFPLFAFSHCRDVVAEVTNAGGFGVLGAVGHTPESLKIELDWIDSRVKGRPYGIDLLIPNKMEDKQGDLAEAELQSRIPDGHRKFVNSLLERHGIDTSDLWSGEYDKRTADSMREPQSFSTWRSNIRSSSSSMPSVCHRSRSWNGHGRRASSLAH